MMDYSPITDYDPHTAVSSFDRDTWQKPFACEPNGGNCVEVNLGAGAVGLRDSKLADGPVFKFDAAEWSTFVSAVKAGQFDV